MLYLTGYGLTLDDLKQFRQWGSQTPGHPEVHHTNGVEVDHRTARPGLRATASAWASPSATCAAGSAPSVFDHHTFVIAGDGYLEEGISHEAASLAGHLGLGRLVYIYDDNHITIDGPTELALTDDAGKRFEAYGWHVDHIGEVANDLDALEAALRRAMAVEDKPSLIMLRSHIGYPSPKYTDTAHAHGNPLGDDEIAGHQGDPRPAARRDLLGPRRRARLYRAAGARGGPEREAWEQRLAALDRRSRRAATRASAGTGLAGWEAKLPTWSRRRQASPPAGPAARAPRHRSTSCPA